MSRGSRDVWLIAAALFLGIVAVVTLHPRSGDEASTGSRVVVVPAAHDAQHSPAIVAPPSGPATTARSIVRDDANGRVDPGLDRLLTTADADTRTMHDQIAQQSATGSDTSRERQVADVMGNMRGARIEGIICRATICEIVGTLPDPTVLHASALGDRLARLNLALGPSAVASSSAGREQAFVQYLDVQGDAVE